MPDTYVQLERIRKLLAKAGAKGATREEAEALTGRAGELMARYGIDRALLAATLPETDQPADRVRAAEQHAASQAGTDRPGGEGQSAALVLASRQDVTAHLAKAAYPVTRKARVTCTGSGYRDGLDQGSRADIGTTRLSQQARGSLR